MGKGIFYAVSVGAGDPLDMTLRAKQVLEQADVVVAPVIKQGSALKESVGCHYNSDYPKPDNK